MLREIESIRHDASLLKEQMTLVKEDIRAVIILFFNLCANHQIHQLIHMCTSKFQSWQDVESLSPEMSLQLTFVFLISGVA